MEKKTLTYDEILTELAKKLSINYYDNSLSTPKEGGTTKRDKANNHLQEILNLEEKSIWPKDFVNSEKDMPITRNIVVIGAGASHDAYDEIPLATDAIKRIKEALNFEKLLKIKDKSKHTSFEHHYDHKLEKLREIYNLDSNDFESQLSILVDYFGQEKVREEVKKIYNKYRYHISPLYEILAHLFKNRFVDAIINFNFDEMLDQAIEDEMLNSNYHKIYTDAHCKELEELMINNRLKVPIYIKPHGTSSDKTSLKFTKEDYFGVVNEVQQTLSDVISGKVTNEVEKSDSVGVKEVNLIIIGFNLMSVEFNKILQKDLPVGSTIFHFSTTNVSLTKLPKEKNETVDYFKNYSKNRKNEKNNINPVDYGIDAYENGKGPLASSFCKIWEKIEQSYENDTFKPRGLSRHKLISELFYERYYKNVGILSDKSQSVGEEGNNMFKHPEASGKRIIENNQEYFKQRAKVELLISLAKSDGIIDINILLKERFGIYYLLYLNEMRKTKKRYSDKKKSKSKKIETIGSICKSIDLVQKFGTSDAANTAAMIYSYKKGKVKENLVGSLKKIYNKIHSNNSKEQSLKSLLKYLNDMNDSIYSNDIRPKFDSRHLNVFECYDANNVLYTDLSLKTKIYDMFTETQKNDWDLALITSERANILKQLRGIKKTIEKNSSQNDSNNIKKPKKICLVLASPNHEKNSDLLEEFKDDIIDIDEINYQKMFLREKIRNPQDKSPNKEIIALSEAKKSKDKKRIFYLPFWLHHHHMIILLKKIKEEQGRENILKQTGWSFVNGIYYFRDGLSNKINPLFIPRSLNNVIFDNDHSNLILKFFSDLFKAKQRGINERVEIGNFDHNNLDSNPTVFKNTVKEVLRKIHEQIP